MEVIEEENIEQRPRMINPATMEDFKLETDEDPAILMEIEEESSKNKET